MASFERLTLVPVFIRRLSGDMLTQEKENKTGFRKIEPKPCIVSVVKDESEELAVKKRTKKDNTVRFLGSNATRRGVRLCITCKGRVGYRSKKCKHCKRMAALTKEGKEDSCSKDNLFEKENNTKHENTSLPSLHEIQEDNDVDLFCKDTVKPTSKELTTDDIENLSNDIAEQSNKYFSHNVEPQLNPFPRLGQCKITQEKGFINVQEFQNHQDVDIIDTIFTEETMMNKDDQRTICDIEEDLYKKDITSEQQSSTDHLMEYVVNNEEITGVSSDKQENITSSKRKVNSGRKKKQKIICSVFQFVRIEPKPCPDEKPSKKYLKVQPNYVKQSGKTDPKRFLTSNATRRGVMSCPLCQKEVGCRSKTCKHCKVAIHFTETKALENTNLLIVQLSLLTDPECVVFSVKKMTTPSEERCFLKQTNEARKDFKEEGNTWSCECVESDQSICEHVMFFFRSPKIIQARTAMLTAQAIDCLPIDNTFKDKLKELWEKNQTQELPLVQQVALNTLVVMETLEKDYNINSCVHIRFEKVKRQSFVQPHIFCSGKSCSYWSPCDSPITCLHYCISLWAIASDNQLQGYFKIFLEAPQVYLHSEVFESMA